MSSAFPSTVVFLLTAIVLGAPVEARELRVCADPNNLPFSKADGSGFENKIASILAKQLGADLSYTWFAQRRGFLRNTLNAGKCDVVMGYAAGIPLLRTTRPYYRTSYVFVRRATDAPIRSFDDPLLRTARVGVELVGDDGANTPPVHDLAKRGIVGNVHGYMVYGDYQTEAPQSPIMAAVANGTLDVAIVWGPVAGYFAARETRPLSIYPVPFDAAALDLPMTFDIAAGVRKSDEQLAQDLNAAITARRADIDAILARYGIPRADTTTLAEEPK
jgi:mxaJ protein